MIRAVAIACCLLGLAAAALVMRDYERFEAFYWDQAADVAVTGTFRPNLEMMVMGSGMFPRRAELLQTEIMLLERALHAHPKLEVLCRYAGALYASGRPSDADTVMARMQIAYPTVNCPTL